jgi:hypothetical protein
MARTSKDAWNDVGERFTSWGRLVADRYREQQRQQPTSDETAREERSLEDAARDVSDQLSRAFTALGDTLRDADAKERLLDAVKALGDAVSVTVSETTEEVRTRLRSSESTAPSDSEPDSPPPGPATPS